MNPEVANPDFIRQYETAVKQSIDNPGPMLVNRFYQRFIRDSRDASGGMVHTLVGNDPGQ